MQCMVVDVPRAHKFIHSTVGEVVQSPLQYWDQIIVNNLYNDHNDNEIYKVKKYHFIDKS